MKRAKQRKFVAKWNLYDLCGVPHQYRDAVELAAKSIQEAIDADIIKQILEKQNETH